MPAKKEEPADWPLPHSNCTSPISVVESDDSMDYRNTDASAFTYEARAVCMNANSENLVGPYTPALCKASEVIGVVIGNLVICPSVPMPEMDVSLLHNIAELTSPLFPQKLASELTSEMVLTQEEVIVTASAAHKDPDTLRKLRARATIEALESARYELGIDLVAMAGICA
jgi:hypothetical protein